MVSSAQVGFTRDEFREEKIALGAKIAVLRFAASSIMGSNGFIKGDNLFTRRQCTHSAETATVVGTALFCGEDSFAFELRG